MDPGIIIGALALFTIGSTLALAIAHFGYHLKDPKNLEAVKRVAEDRESATTKMEGGSPEGRSLRERLNNAPGINDRLGHRPEGLGPLDVMFGTKWADLRSSLGPPPRR